MSHKNALQNKKTDLPDFSFVKKKQNKTKKCVSSHTAVSYFQINSGLRLTSR